MGDVVTDIVARHEHPLAPGTDTAAAIGVRPGGSGANTAAWAARSGAPTTLLARVGSDSARWHAEALESDGVRPVFRIDGRRPTARVIALVDAAGERTMVTDRGAGGELSPGDWDDALLDGTAMLHLSGYVLFTGSGRRLAETAMDAAVRRGVPVSVDPASTGFLEMFGTGRFLDVTAPSCGTVLPNEDEAALLGGVRDPDTAAARLSERYGLAVVKLGARGAVAARDGRVVARCPARSAQTVDSIGAGDAFAGGFLAAVLAAACGGTGTCAGAPAPGVLPADVPPARLPPAEAPPADRLPGDRCPADVPLAAALTAGCRAGALAVTTPGGRPPQQTPPPSAAPPPAPHAP